MLEAISSSIRPIKCSKKGNIYEGTNAAKVTFPIASLLFSAPALKDVYKSSKEAKVANTIYSAACIAFMNIGIGAIIDGLFNSHRSKGADDAMDTVMELASMSEEQEDYSCSGDYEEANPYEISEKF